MIYNAEILKIDYIDDYEGHITIKLNSQVLLVSYQAPYDFAKEYIRIHEILPVDLWIVYGEAKRIYIPIKEIPNNHNIGGGIIKGQVRTVFSSDKFRVDCGCFEIDICNEEPIDLCENDYIETRGTYFIFFPDTDWNKENYWD